MTADQVGVRLAARWATGILIQRSGISRWISWDARISDGLHFVGHLPNRGNYMRAMLRVLLVFLLASFVPLPSKAQVEVKEITTRPGVTVRFVYAKADNPVASAVLFQGGSGNIGIFPNGSTRVQSFLSGGAH